MALESCTGAGASRKMGKPVTLVSWTDPEDGPPGLAKHGQRAMEEAETPRESMRFTFRPSGKIRSRRIHVLAVVKGVLRTSFGWTDFAGSDRQLSLARRREIPL